MKRLIGLLLVSNFLFVIGCSSAPIDFKGLYDRIFKKDDTTEKVEVKEQELKEQVVEQKVNDQIILRPIYKEEQNGGDDERTE